MKYRTRWKQWWSQRWPNRSSTASDEAGPVYALIEQRVKEGMCILLWALSLFLFIGLLSYQTQEHNAAGAWGYGLAHAGITLLGGVAYLWPVGLAYFGYLRYRIRSEEETLAHTVPKILWWLRLLGFTTCTVTACALMSLFWSIPQWPYGSGGWLGFQIAQTMTPAFNLIGSTVLLLSFQLTGLTLLTGISWLEIVKRGGSFLHHLLQVCQRAWRLRREKARAQKVAPVVFQSTGINPSIHQALSLSHLQTSVPIARAPSVVQQLKTWIKPKASVNKSMEVSSELEEDSTDLGETLAGCSPVSLPEVSLLEAAELTEGAHPHYDLTQMSVEVEARLMEYGIQAQVVEAHPGPVITRFELALAPGIKVNRITTLVKDLARSLSVLSVRVVEVIPGKSTVGLEIPNPHRVIVRLREILESASYIESRSPLTLALGKDINGLPVTVELGKMPHLLVAGTTGSGKSVGLNAMLLSLLYKAGPDQIRLILIDPKMLELAIYEGIPHLLTPVVTDMKDAANALRWCVAEMERRYQVMAALGVRHIGGYNRRIHEAQAQGKSLRDPLWPEHMSHEAPLLGPMPFIVVVVDEFADLMMVVGKKVEELIARIAQKARAAGIHLILATQRPSVDVITGLIKANIPTRIAFQVSSKIDSRTILDQSGAEQLLGYGDMLYLPPGSGLPVRVHGAYVADEEVHRVVRAWKERGKPDYIASVVQAAPVHTGDREEEEDYDELYDEAVSIVLDSRRASISHVQRRLKIGYNRAARMIERMEKDGVVGPVQSNGMREVLVPPATEINE